MKPTRVVLLVMGTLLALPALAMLAGGVALGGAAAFGRDSDGYFHASIDGLHSNGVAVTTEDMAFDLGPGTPSWLVRAVQARIRIEATSTRGETPVFVGIGPAKEVNAYLASASYDQIDDVKGRTPVYRSRVGTDRVAPPASQSFWAASASGPGTQELRWKVADGRWTAVLLNADGSGPVTADVEVGAKPAALAGWLVFLLVGGAAALAVAVTLIVAGATAGRPHNEQEAAEPGALAGAGVAAVAGAGGPVSPVRLEASLDEGVSRWKWLVKWILALPHYIVLLFLWLAFAVLTVVAGFSILLTGTYPRAIFDFNVGVMRWSWRVNYYAASGGLGTDRYPPFSLADDPSYPARLSVAYPERLSRGLVLVKWWLLALPHYLILALLVGGSFRWADNGANRFRLDPAASGGLVGLLVLVAAVILLFRGRYPRPLFNLIVGLNRWMYRVMVYAALMTDSYPPFRLDQGGEEPPVGPPPASPGPEPARDLSVAVPGRSSEILAPVSQASW